MMIYSVQVYQKYSVPFCSVNVTNLYTVVSGLMFIPNCVKKKARRGSRSPHSPKIHCTYDKFSPTHMAGLCTNIEFVCIGVVYTVCKRYG